jgi:hypothetical protein
MGSNPTATNSVRSTLAVAAVNRPRWPTASYSAQQPADPAPRAATKIAKTFRMQGISDNSEPTLSANPSNLGFNQLKKTSGIENSAGVVIREQRVRLVEDGDPHYLAQDDESFQRPAPL